MSTKIHLQRGLLWPGLAVALIAAGVLAATHFTAYRTGRASLRADWNAEKAQQAQDARDAEREARNREQARARLIQEAQDAKDAKIRSINARLADALERLRQRPDRLPEPARAACSGATGAELSGRDAAFLERFAARADSLRAELGACQDREHAVTR